MVDCFPLRRIRGYAVHFEQLLDFVQQGLLGFIVHGSEMLAAFEHEVFEVVGKTGGFGRIVLAADFYCYVSLDSGLFLIYGHEYFHSVLHRINLCLERVVRDGFIFAARC